MTQGAPRQGRPKGSIHANASETEMNATTAAAHPTTKINGQFSIVPAWIQERLRGDHLARAVYEALAGVADYTSWVVRKFSLAKLAGLIGRSVPTLKKGLDALKEIGAVSWKKGGFGWTNEYRLHPNRKAHQKAIAWDEPPEPPENPICKPACNQSASQLAPVQNLPQKKEGPQAPTPSSRRKRDARDFVGAVRKAGEAAGFRVVTRRRDVETVAFRMGEYAEPYDTWREVYEWLYQRRNRATAFQRGCLASPVQFASQLGALAGDMQADPGYGEFRQKRLARLRG